MSPRPGMMTLPVYADKSARQSSPLSEKRKQKLVCQRRTKHYLRHKNMAKS
ncbi:hypothetical protein [Candidatus Tokpelaia sp.]|uniref:hypothetical protein n=1 Tax=Candidatus Tokpelaia sp. TaxID=2233777 RepID=UPI001680FBDF|nr:hypothetical protein [Candidatus Tokpelaia sp.]